MKPKTLVSGYSYYYPEVLTHKCLKKVQYRFLIQISPHYREYQLTATDAPAPIRNANGNFQFNFSKQNREWLSLLRMYIRKDMNW